MIEYPQLLNKQSLLLKGMGICWLILACVWLVSCQQTSIDDSYLEGVPCIVPCWQGITPGKTDEATAMTILSDPNLVKSNSLDCDTDPDEPSQNRCTFSRKGGERGSIKFQNGIVTGINIKSHKLTLAEGIDALGQPDFVYTKKKLAKLEQYDCYDVFFYYLRGIVLFTSGCEQSPAFEFSPDRQSAKITTDMPIIDLGFFIPSNNLESTLQNLYIDSDFIQRVMANSNIWKGYNFYELEMSEPHG